MGPDNILDLTGTHAAELESRVAESLPFAASVSHPVLTLIGAACALGMPESRCDEAPAYLRKRLKAGHELDGLYHWHRTLSAPRPGADSGFPPPGLASFSRRLAKEVAACVEQEQRFMVFGGDHACAIGTWNGAARGLRTWNGAARGLRHQGTMGLVWIDAHMDAHTSSTTPSGRAHGMPVATLLGAGDPKLEFFGKAQPPSVLPGDLCLVGVRSYEGEEAALLERLGVRIYPMHEVQSRGIAAVMREAVARVTAHTTAFGISLDLDALDPRNAPAVTTAVPKGISPRALLPPLREACAHPRFMGMEVVEFNPPADRDGRTLRLVEELVKAAAPSRDAGQAA